MSPAIRIWLPTLTGGTPGVPAVWEGTAVVWKPWQLRWLGPWQERLALPTLWQSLTYSYGKWSSMERYG